MTGERRGPPVLIIAPGGAGLCYWRELWAYRELFAILAWRDVAVRYRQTVVGVAWAVVRPLLATLVFTLVFGRLASLPGEGSAPYAVMVFTGMLAWSLMSSIVNDAAASLVGNANLVGKVYFPRMVVPGATAVVALVDFAVGLVILIALMACYGTAPGWRLVCLPAFVLLAVLASAGPALFLAALNVEYRDFRYVVPFLLQLGLYVSPVGFSSAVVPDQWRLLYSLNPAVGVIDGFRWCLLGGESTLYAPGVAAAVAIAALALWGGLAWFRRAEQTFADVI